MDRFFLLATSLALLVVCSLAQVSGADGVSYKTEEGRIVSVPHIGMVPVSQQHQLADRPNPYPVYPLDGSYLFAGPQVDDNLTITFADSDDRLTLYGVGFPEELAGGSTRDAAAYARKLLKDTQQVLVVTDDTQRDRKGRLLAYIFAGEQFMNQQLLVTGAAAFIPSDRKPRFSRFLSEAEGFAKEHDLGIWLRLKYGGKNAQSLEGAVGVDHTAARLPVLFTPWTGLYHKIHCELGKGGDPLTIDAAKAQNAKPCRKCHPVFQGPAMPELPDIQRRPDNEDAE